MADELTDKELREVCFNIFRQAHGREEHFQDGYESVFSRELSWLIQTYSHRAITAIEGIFINTHEYLVSEALRQIGYIKHEPTNAVRRWLLEKHLQSSYVIRDGAIIGIASMDDPNSIPAIKQALQFETAENLRIDLLQVLEQLEATPHEGSPS